MELRSASAWGGRIVGCPPVLEQYSAGRARICSACVSNRSATARGRAPHNPPALHARAFAPLTQLASGSGRGGGSRWSELRVETRKERVSPPRAVAERS